MCECAFEVSYIGEERQPVVMIDDFSPDPDGLLAQARAATYHQGGRHYPGMRAKLSADYLSERDDLLHEIFCDVFHMQVGATAEECSFSAVTTPPDRLTPIQRLPHFDGAVLGRLAMLHYLCGPEQGGTSFYRHVSTGFETITEDRLEDYDAALRREVSQEGLPSAEYFSGTGGRFQRIGSVKARFNRLVIYRGVLLHSGDILKSDEIGRPGFSPRLTVNTFFQIDA